MDTRHNKRVAIHQLGEGSPGQEGTDGNEIKDKNKKVKEAIGMGPDLWMDHEHRWMDVQCYENSNNFVREIGRPKQMYLNGVTEEALNRN